MHASVAQAAGVTDILVHLRGLVWDIPLLANRSGLGELEFLEGEGGGVWACVCSLYRSGVEWSSSSSLCLGIWDLGDTIFVLFEHENTMSVKKGSLGCVDS